MLDTDTINLLKKILANYISSKKYKIFVFGSRANGNNRKFSDIDLGILGSQKISITDRCAIETDLENSNLPYRVDLVDFLTVSDKFKSIALRNIIEL